MEAFLIFIAAILTVDTMVIVWLASRELERIEQNRLQRQIHQAIFNAGQKAKNSKDPRYTSLPTGAKISIVPSRVPDDYLRASLRCVTPYCTDSDQIGFGLNLPEGKTVRFSLCKLDALALSTGITDYLTRSQAPSSSGNPSEAVSTPQDGVNVCPPTKSSNAINADG